MILKNTYNKIILILASFACVSSYIFKPSRMFDSDTLWHIIAGEWILSHHTIPTIDNFSWTVPGSPWIAHEWLFELALSLFSKIHLAGIAVFSALIILVGLYFYWKLVNHLTESETTSTFFYLLSLTLLSPGWSARPQLVGYTLFIIILYIIYNGKENPKKLWALPVIIILWANCHASVILGLSVIGMEAVLSFIPKFEVGNIRHIPGNKKNLIYVLITSTIASLINPHGYNLWIFSIKLSLDPVYKNIQEWQPPTSLTNISVIFIFITIAILFLASRKNKADLSLYILSFITLLGAMTSLRHIIYFVIVWIILMAQIAGKLEFPKRVISIFGSLLAVFFIIKFLTLSWQEYDPRLLAEKAGWPVEAVDWLEENRAEKIFNKYNWGGYLIYRGIPVFIDGRADMYHMAGTENDVFIDYINIFNLKGSPPEDILQKHDVKYILLPNDAWQIHYLEKYGWSEVYRDDIAIVLNKL
jgi:hypothetical protein